VAGVLLELSRRVVAWHAWIEPQWRIPTPPLWLGVALAAALIGAAALRGRWWRVACGVAAAGCLGLVFVHPFAPDIHTGELELTAIDVGQGDSLLVVFPGGQRMLLDGGGIPVFGRAVKPQLDIGEDVVAPYLWDRGLRTVDIVALSHAHEDHIGGLPALIENFRPQEVWTGATPDSPSWRAVMKEAAARGVKIMGLQSPRQFSLGGAQVEVLAPAANYVAAASPRNNDSLVLRLRYGRHTFLLPGDIERQVERAMLDSGALGRADVLKVAHHGSKTSSTEEFLDAVNPLFAVVSAGFENSYGHPHREVIERLTRHRTGVFRTDADGLVTIRSDGRRLHVDTWRGRSAQFERRFN
jgi:competence protein ComEC